MLHGDILSEEKIHKLVDALLAAVVIRDLNSRWECQRCYFTDPPDERPGWEPVTVDPENRVLWRRRVVG